MSEPACDRLEERIIRTEIDPGKTMDCLRYGFELCIRVGYEADRITLQQIIWALFVEAARVERSFERPAGKGYGNGWPEIAMTAADHKFAETARVADGMPQYLHTPRRAMPTAAQISRHAEVTIWLRFVHAVDRQQAHDVLWGRASGIPWPVIREATGLSIKRAKNIKAEQLGRIARRLRQELSGAESFDDASPSRIFS